MRPLLRLMRTQIPEMCLALWFSQSAGSEEVCLR
jgi:hypothetical protein